MKSMRDYHVKETRMSGNNVTQDPVKVSIDNVMSDP